MEHDNVNHPKHYASNFSTAWYVPNVRGIECIDITRHLDFCRGNAFKYVWRAGRKGGLRRRRPAEGGMVFSRLYSTYEPAAQAWRIFEVLKEPDERDPYSYLAYLILCKILDGELTVALEVIGEYFEFLKSPVDSFRSRYGREATEAEYD